MKTEQQSVCKGEGVKGGRGLMLPLFTLCQILTSFLKYLLLLDFNDTKYVLTLSAFSAAILLFFLAYLCSFLTILFTFLLAVAFTLFTQALLVYKFFLSRPQLAQRKQQFIPALVESNLQQKDSTSRNEMRSDRERRSPKRSRNQSSMLLKVGMGLERNEKNESGGRTRSRSNYEKNEENKTNVGRDLMDEFYSVSGKKSDLKEGGNDGFVKGPNVDPLPSVRSTASPEKESGVISNHKNKEIEDQVAQKCKNALSCTMAVHKFFHEFYLIEKVYGKNLTKFGKPSSILSTQLAIFQDSDLTFEPVLDPVNQKFHLLPNWNIFRNVIQNSGRIHLETSQFLLQVQ
jgi:hypothetical protein